MMSKNKRKVFCIQAELNDITVVKRKKKKMCFLLAAMLTLAQIEDG